ncbi:MAG: bifunctional cytidylyltransferase/SDR family oxidoreductase [Comamonas sp.]|jgi:2-C-methyl-D-erythritol 4-phosphate cytidylyltransferase|uniref:bifunctional cytidylyltransferase/SDR family oxidoreductase n=1 Tax=Comamonas sp. TaxID=34028 RepID=UPI00282B0AF2|nr:bifunctional cytidylyltransferase/SDR family oxidoreductase [Comamonas sp.]MDR0215256.1 bifunctional cytidylyltransferase/SDR family oxidoreductase [Comamonas sp.]
MSKKVAVILSGGSGSRFGGALPKQFTKLAGKAIIEYTIEEFERSSQIDEIFVVSQTQHIDRTWEIIKKNKWLKVKAVITGGKERFDSTYSALQALKEYEADTKILFHDAVRPLINQKIIRKCVEVLDDFDAVDVVIPSTDTLVEVYDDGCISNIPNRSMMRRGQTPQGFSLGTIQKAYQKAIEANKHVFTCDCGVVRSMLPHTRVATVEGSERNMKVTQPIDLFIAEKFLQAGNSLDYVEDQSIEALQGKNIVIFGGASGIGLEMKNIAILNGANVHVASRSFNGIDITDLESIKDYLADIEKKQGRIDYIVNTAGLLIKKPIDALTFEEITSLINVNYTGAVNVAIAAKKHLEKSSGMLLNFTSSSYTRGRAYYAIYSSTNAAIVNLTQALAEEWEADGVRVNCINPERTATPMRTANFGVEPAELLLDAKDVAVTSLKVLTSNRTGIIIDVRKDGR